MRISSRLRPQGQSRHSSTSAGLLEMSSTPFTSITSPRPSARRRVISGQPPYVIFVRHREHDRVGRRQVASVVSLMPYSRARPPGRPADRRPARSRRSLQLADDVDDVRIADVRHVLLERQSQHRDTRCARAAVLQQRRMHSRATRSPTASLIRRPARMTRDDSRPFGPMRQVVGIDADAVPADQSRGERQEIPFGCRRRQHVTGVDAECGGRSRDSSFMKAMLRSRWVFSITLAASATLIEGAA